MGNNKQNLIFKNPYNPINPHNNYFNMNELYNTLPTTNVTYPNPNNNSPYSMEQKVDYSLPNSPNYISTDFNITPNYNTTDYNEINNEEEVNLTETNFIGVDDETKKRRSLVNMNNEEEEEDMDDTKLPPSKTPIIDAILYCALKGEYGISIEYRDDSKILFKVTDYDRFYEKQKRVCSKQNPTDDESSRIKTIQRWFKNFPTKKERSKTNQTIFFFSVEKSVSEDKFKKIIKIMEKLECSINVNKRRRTK